jgi:hypothetical protein
LKGIIHTEHEPVPEHEHEQGLKLKLRLVDLGIPTNPQPIVFNVDLVGRRKGTSWIPYRTVLPTSITTPTTTSPSLKPTRPIIFDDKLILPNRTSPRLALTRRAYPSPRLFRIDWVGRKGGGGV